MKKRSFPIPKNAIFMKIFIPIIGIMIIQGGIIIGFLFASNTMETLNNNAIEILSKNAQNRSMNLEHQMVHFWSNLDRLAYDIDREIHAYLTEHNLTMEDVLGNDAREIALLGNLSQSLIDALRMTGATGVFMYFLNPAGFVEEVQQLNGLYYRDLSLVPNIHANLIFLRGHVDIARRSGISLDSLWDEFFTFDPSEVGAWQGFSTPQLAQRQRPDAPAELLSYWNGPHYLNPESPNEANKKITYNRLIFFEGRPIAMIGTEMQLTHIERHFPSRDLDNFAESGYLLMRYNTHEAENQFRGSEIIRITGAFINRLFGEDETLTLVTTGRDEVFSSVEYPEVQLVYHPIRLYNPGSPFVAEQWALAAVGTQASLFAMTQTLTQVIILATVISSVVVLVLLFFAVRRITKPIDALIKQLGESEGDTLITYQPSSYEIDLLCQTLNDMTLRSVEISKEANAAKDRFLAQMSHELRTPITAVLGISEIQMQNKGNAPETGEAFSKIYSSSTALLGIVNDILDISRIEAGKMEIVAVSYEVENFMNDAAHMNMVYLTSKAIEFKVTIDPQIPRVLEGDVLRLRQIISNMLSNAFKYTEKGKVQFVVKTVPYEEEGYVNLRLTIQDTGQGMSEAQVARIFTGYERFHERSKPFTAGTGLGMPITKNLVELMGGTMEIHSDLDRGTTVVIQVPQKVMSKEVIGEDKPQTVDETKRPKVTPIPMPHGSVMVVDDVTANVFVARGLLGLYKIKNIKTFNNGAEALEHIREGASYDLILMDQMMPEMDGVETTRRIRALGYTKPIIAFTANALVGQEAYFLENGFDGFISKPIQTTHLHELLCRFIGGDSDA